MNDKYEDKNSNKKIIESKKIRYITIAQIIAMFLIVFSHSVPNRQNVPEILDYTGVCAVYIALPVFMWASGYLLVKTEALTKYSYWEYQLRRFMRLILPYIFISSLLFIPKYILSAYSSVEVELSISSLFHALIIPREGVLPHLWFLPTLMILTMISPIIDKITKNKFAAIILIMCSLSLIFLPSITDFLSLNDVKLYLFWYVFGVCTAKYLSFNTIIKNKWLLIFTGMGYLLFKIYLTSSAILWLITSFLALICIIGLSELFDSINRGNKVWRLLDGMTLPVYILSLPIQNFFEILCIRFGIPYLFTVCCMFIVGIIIPIIIVRLIVYFEQKTSIKLISKLIGI